MSIVPSKVTETLPFVPLAQRLLKSYCSVKATKAHLIGHMVY